MRAVVIVGTATANVSFPFGVSIGGAKKIVIRATKGARLSRLGGVCQKPEALRTYFNYGY